MPRRPRQPKYCHHKPTNRGYARFPRGDGTYETVYFPGPWMGGRSRAAYDRAVADWLAGGRTPRGAEATGGEVTVGELVLAWLPVAREHYRKSGRPTSEYGCQVLACRALCELYADTPVRDMTAAKLEALRAAMCRRTDGRKGRGDRPWSRSTVNIHLARVKHLFKWGARRRLVPSAVYSELALVEGVRARSGAARESAPKAAVPAFDFGCVQLCAGDQCRAMLWLQWLNGIRSGGLIGLRPCDVDRSGDVWVYREPTEAAAKTGRETHYLGPRAQAILGPWLDAAAGPRARAFPRYTVASYRRRVERLCARLGVPHWHPHMLRRAHGQAVEDRYGRDAAQKRLGHARPTTTQLYTKDAVAVLERIAREMG